MWLPQVRTDVSAAGDATAGDTTAGEGVHAAGAPLFGTPLLGPTPTQVTARIGRREESGVVKIESPVGS